jgi:hypothetical protein
MKNIISKELLSEITGIPCNAIQSISIGRSIVSARKINGVVEEYNIHELAHKCKDTMQDKIVTVAKFGGEDLPKLELKACEWIYKEIQK